MSEPTPARRASLGAAAVAAAAVAVSLSNVLAPVIYDAGGNPPSYLAARFLCFVALCGLWFRLAGRTPALPPGRRGTAYAVGVVFAGGAGALIGSFAYMPVSLAILIFYTFPLLTAAATAILDRRPPRPLEAACLPAAFAGLALALDVSFAGLDPAGLALAALAAVGVATAYVWHSRALADLDAVPVTFHMSVSGAVAATLVALAFGAVAVPAGGPGWLAFSGAVLTFAAAFFLMFLGLRVIGPVRTALIMNLEPVATIALAMLLLGEPLSPRQALGAALVVGAVVVAQRAARRRLSAP